MDFKRYYDLDKRKLDLYDENGKCEKMDFKRIRNLERNEKNKKII